MVLDDIDINSRLESPDNLINRLRSLTRLDKSNRVQTPCLPPSADDVIADLDEKLKSTSIRTKATKILSEAMNQIQSRIEEIDKPEKLARIAESMNKIIESHTPKKETGPQIGQVIIYTPSLREEKEYPTIDIRRTEESA